ncbi:MAG: hypothetical protein IKG90_06315 [Bacteroidales bacterium]|nr:hypothetical protein [Bacteroidales bacterium]
MDQSNFEKKVGEWLEGTDAVQNAVWTISESNEPKSVVITVSIRETFQKNATRVLTRDIKGTSHTEDSEEAICKAVLALNEELLDLL